MINFHDRNITYRPLVGKRGAILKQAPKKIAIFGGSFNPPHLGHLEICRHVIDTGKADQVWVIPCFKHPFGKSLASYNDRLEMCRLAFADLGEGVQVSDVEKKLGSISHTVRTIEYLKKTFPDVEFFMITGGDISKERGDWKDFHRIEKMVKIIEIPRGKNSFIPDISSTEIRKLIKSKKDFCNQVPKPVAQYISTHSLYTDLT